MASSTDKIRENRLRRMAERQGLQLQKSRRRDPRAVGYGTWQIVDPQGNRVASGSLDEVEAWLTSEDRLICSFGPDPRRRQ